MHLFLNGSAKPGGFFDSRARYGFTGGGAGLAPGAKASASAVASSDDCGSRCGSCTSSSSGGGASRGGAGFSFGLSGPTVDNDVVVRELLVLLAQAGALVLLLYVLFLFFGHAMLSQNFWLGQRQPQLQAAAGVVVGGFGGR